MQIIFQSRQENSYQIRRVPRLQESQILQKNLTSLYKNRKLCKFVTMSNISYKILITFLQKMHFFGKKFLQKMWCVISTKSSKIIKLPAKTATVAVYNAQTVPGSQQKAPNCYFWARRLYMQFNLRNHSNIFQLWNSWQKLRELFS